MGSRLSTIPPAGTIPFDNTTNGFLASNVQAAIEEAKAAVSFGDFGDGSDGVLTLSSGTFPLPRTMYYSSVDLSGTAIVDTAGFKLYVNGLLKLSGTAAIRNNGAAGTAAAGNTPGVAGSGGLGVEVGAGGAGTNGVVQNTDSVQPAAIIGYGAAGGKGGDGGDSAAGANGNGAAGGTVTYWPERVLRHDHWRGAGVYKQGGNGGAGGAGGGPSLLSTAGAGSGGGGGGGVVLIFAYEIDNSSSQGFRARGGGSGAGGNAASGNSGGGGSGGSGGGGFIYIVSMKLTNLGILVVTGGTPGAAGAGAGTGTAGSVGATGTTGHTAVLNLSVNTWQTT